MNFKREISVPRVLISVLVVLALNFSGCSPHLKGWRDGKYDSSHLYVERIDETLGKVSGNIYRIETATRFRGYEGEVSTLKIVGMASTLDDRHLLTAKHVTVNETYQVRSPLGLLRIPIHEEQKINETTSIVFDDGTRIPLNIIYRDAEMDFAVLRSVLPLKAPVYAIGDSDDFGVANLVILPANFQTGLNIRMGYITQLDFVRYGSIGEVADRKLDIFGVSAVVNEGDSGSPILLARDGKLELGGVVSFIVLPARGLGYGLKINPILEKLKQHLGDQDWFVSMMEKRAGK